MCSFVLIVCFCSVLSVNANYNNSVDYFGQIEETQYTYCKIDTEEIKATANATITRQLKGVCTLKELKRSVSLILGEINSLKSTLQCKMRSKRLRSVPLDATVTTDDREFAYYWAIYNASHYLTHSDIVISPNFNFRENFYYLRLSPLEHDNYATLDLQSPFKFNNYYKILILDSQGFMEDVSSLPMRHNTTFRLSTRKLLKYAIRNNNVLLIKLIIYV